MAAALLPPPDGQLPLGVEQVRYPQEASRGHTPVRKEDKASATLARSRRGIHETFLLAAARTRLDSINAPRTAPDARNNRAPTVRHPRQAVSRSVKETHVPIPRTGNPGYPLGKPALYAMVGASGSGKSTIARAFPPAWRLELDALRATASDSPGDQTATPAAVAAFRALLDARLERGLPVLADNTNTRPAARAHLLQRARAFGMPSVAIRVPTDLKTCLARQAGRSPDKQVPSHAVTEQHAALPSREQLLAEGWEHVHDAADLDLLHLALQRAADAAAEKDPLGEIRAIFGDDLAAAFAYTDREHGRIAIAGRSIELRHSGGEPYDRPWQARLPDERCDCGGDLWVPAGDAAELFAAYHGESDDEAVCGRCYDTLFVG